MERKEFDHTEDEYNGHIKLYIFYKYENNDRIIISSVTLLEALDMLYNFNPNYQRIYNIDEFLLQHTDERIYDICNIDEFYSSLPFFVSEEQYNKLKIYDKSFSEINHQKRLKVDPERYEYINNTFKKYWDKELWNDMLKKDREALKKFDEKTNNKKKETLSVIKKIKNKILNK